MKDKILELDIILASLEDVLHGEESKQITEARKLLIEIEEEIDKKLAILLYD